MHGGRQTLIFIILYPTASHGQLAKPLTEGTRGDKIIIKFYRKLWSPEFVTGVRKEII
jgi:hypothetical protein